MKKMFLVMSVVVFGLVQLAGAGVLMDFNFDDFADTTELESVGWTFGGEVTPSDTSEESVRTWNGERVLSLDAGDATDSLPFGTVNPQAGFAWATPVDAGKLVYRYENSNSYSNTYIRIRQGTTELFSVRMVKDTQLVVIGSTSDTITIADNSQKPTTVELIWDATVGMFSYKITQFDGSITEGDLDFAAAGTPDGILCELTTANHNSREWYLYEIMAEPAVGKLTGAPVVSEEGETTDTFDIVLVSEPDADVTAWFSIADPNDAKFLVGGVVKDEHSVTFTNTSWATPQTVTVQAVDDLLAEGDEITMILLDLVSDDPNFDGGIVTPKVEVTLIDNDQGQILIVEDDGSTDVNEEGETSDSYTLMLSDRPTTGTVTIDLTADPDQVTLDPAQVIFDSSN